MISSKALYDEFYQKLIQNPRKHMLVLVILKAVCFGFVIGVEKSYSQWTKENWYLDLFTAYLEDKCDQDSFIRNLIEYVSTTGCYRLNMCMPEGCTDLAYVYTHPAIADNPELYIDLKEDQKPPVWQFVESVGSIEEVFEKVMAYSNNLTNDVLILLPMRDFKKAMISITHVELLCEKFNTQARGIVCDDSIACHSPSRSLH